MQFRSNINYTLITFSIFRSNGYTWNEGKLEEQKKEKHKVCSNEVFS